MREFIANVSSGVPVLSQLVERGEFDLVKDDIVIPPQLWDTLVVPGSTVTMRARSSASPPIDKKASWFRRSISKGGA